MKIKIYFKSSDDSGTSFEPIPPGIYEAKVFGMDYGQANTGTHCQNIEFENLGPTHEGRHMWPNLYLTEKASWKFGGLCGAVEIAPTEELETKDLLGKSLRIGVKEVEGSDGSPRSDMVGF